MRSWILLSLLTLANVHFNINAGVDAFTFMKGWKMPKRDRAKHVAIQKFGDKKLAVITGASSPLGEQTIQDLLATGEYHVIGAYATAQDVDAAAVESQSKSTDGDDTFTPMLCDAESFESVKDFCSQVHTFRGAKTVDRLLCQPQCDATATATNSAPVFTRDGHERIMQANYLSNYLLTSQLLDAMIDSPEARVTMVGNVSPANSNSAVAVADVNGLQGFKHGFKDPIAMVDGSDFQPEKARQDAILCQQLLTNFLHTKYNKLTGVVFNTLDCANTNNDDQVKTTGVSAATTILHKAKGAQSGFNFAVAKDGSTLKEQEATKKAYDIDAAYELVQLCHDITNSEFPAIKQVTSPCPTLKVVGAVTKGKVKREELKRMQQGRPGISEPIVDLKPSKRQRVAAFADRTVSAVLRQTIGRVARLAGKNVLGEIPDEALTGSYDETALGAVEVTEEDIDQLQAAITNQLAKEKKSKFGDRKLVIMTGTSSGLGRKAALALLRTGDYHVIGAIRDLDKMEAVAEVDGFDLENFTPMYCEMNSFESVRQFCKNVDEFRGDKALDRLVCNAGIYQPSLPYAKWSADGHEQTMQTNFLAHFLMISELMTSMEASPDPRVTMVGSVTGNDNTVGGGGVYPIADLHDLDGFKSGFDNPIEMADGYGFDGAKAYKDSKLCLMMLSNFLHTKYHKTTGIAFSSIYPGCIAESPLFREKRGWFRKYFPIFMKFITGGFVSEHEAGQRLFQVVHDPRCSKSGVYWSWNGGPREGRGSEAIEKGGQISGGGGAGGGWDSIFENDQSSKVLNIDTVYNLFTTASKISGASWPYEQSAHLEVTSSAENNIEVVPGSTLGSASNKTMVSSESSQA